MRRHAITSLSPGGCTPSKALNRSFPPSAPFSARASGLRAAIIGDGELRPKLQAAAPANSRIEFTGPLPQSEVRAWLRRTRVFVSGCETEALGIGYLEALSQGCAVVMPACGGGLEIAPELIGSAIHLYSGEGSEPVARALRSALTRSARGRLARRLCAPRRSASLPEPSTRSLPEPASLAEAIP